MTDKEIDYAEFVTEGDDGPEIKDAKALLDAFDKAKRQAKKFREERDAARADAGEAEGRGESRYKARTVQAEARLALQAAGVKDVDRLMGFIKADDINLNDKGELEGLNTQIEALKESLPEVFDAKRRVGGQADLFDGTNEAGNPRHKTSAEILAERLKK